MTRLLLGGYTSGGDGGLGLADLDGTRFGSPRLVAEADNPSYVVVSPDRRFAYAVLEREEGAVASWEVTDSGMWRPLGEQPTDGADPCHLALSPDGRWLAAANYSSGSVCVHPVREDGSLGARTQLVRHHGQAGPVSGRQDGPRAHQVLFMQEDGLLVCDLGLDVVIGYRLDGSIGRLTEVARTAFPPGTGPRHLALTADAGTAYVLGELASTLTSCRVEGLRLVPVATSSTRPERASGDSTAAEVVVTSGGEVLASNRGDDTVAVIATDGGLDLRRVVSCEGHWPRWIGFGADEDVLIVANERSDSLVVLRRDNGGWVARSSLAWTRPTCVVVLD